MKGLISVILAILGMSIIFWFVAFEVDPYSVCKNHPKKRKTHLICKPFNIEVEKPDVKAYSFRKGKF